jgi:RNA 2',3'-cyclic 3'-phosphodiesterase
VTGEAGEKLVRAFVAIDLDAAMRDRLAELIETLRDRLREVRWVRPEGIHLTLRFLGYARWNRLETLGDALRGLANEHAAAAAKISGLGTFPERGRPRVFWIGIAVPSSVLRLQQACERAAVAAGFEAETRPFAPHLTLGRWRQPAPRPTLPEADLGRTRLDTLVLYRSQPGPAGSVYTPLQTFPLSQAGEGGEAR